MKTILASDLDGTLIKNNTVPMYNINSLNNLKSSGGMFIIATGRPYNGVSPLIKEFNLDVDYSVLLNGALIIDKSKNVILHKIIPFSIVKEIISYVQNNSPKISLDTGFTTYAVNNVYEDLLYIEKNNEEISLISLDFEGTPVETIDEICTSINNLFNNDSVAYRNTNYIDVVPNGCSKGNALEHICSSMILESTNLYTIGDSFNDISMFDITKNSFTFHDCEDTLKNYASNLVDSVSQCIDDYILK